MNIEELKDIKWDERNLKIFNQFLKELGEEDYAEFNRRIIPDMGDAYGIRVPILRKISNNIGKSKNIRELYDYLRDKEVYEEKLLQGMIIPKLDYENVEEILKAIDEYILRINNWAICDSFVSTLKQIVNKNRELFFNKIKEYVKSDNPWEIRFGLILLNNYYSTNEYLDFIFDTVSSIKSQHYYVKMGIAWLISTCYISNKDKVTEFIKSNSMDKWCRNKSIQKIVESTRVSKEEKLEIKKLKV